MPPPIKVALSHDWLNGMRGGEKCLEVLCELFPAAPIYTLFYESGKVTPSIASHPIRVSPIQRIPGVFKNYRAYLPLFSWAAESHRLNDFDLIVSTSHCVAKGVRKRPDAVHICYCFTPVRYAWGFFEEYFGEKGALSKGVIRFFVNRLRDWDRRASDRVDHFVAISHHVRKRIEEFYGRKAEVIYPPADTDFYTPLENPAREDFYLVVSALVPYKRIELAVRAFSRSGRPLVVIGDGPEREALARSAGNNVRFLGWQPDEVLRDHYRRARALIFPGEEDFGIVPVEAQACGVPVIAFEKGGALETVLDGKTGLFFKEPTEAGLADAVHRFEKTNWDPRAARENALRFSRLRFRREMMEMIRKKTDQEALRS